ncbi:MAG: hypothetical protein NT049_16775 [Planctomycetota bacterium]|nr:hypothetical protein [Planctomycetota bacterium]
MFPIRRAAVATCLFFIGLSVCAAPARACNVPVFRYALERWAPAPYEVLIFHRGPLSAEGQAAVADLRARVRADADDSPIVLLVTDLDAAPSAAAKKLWDAAPGASLPWMIVRYPESVGVAENLWAGPLGREAAGAAVDSPLRRQIARDLIRGESGVFLLLECGNREKDEAAAKLLAAQLAQLEKTLELPKPAEGQWNDPVYDEKGPPPMRLGLKMVRLSRTDPAEQFFVKMLLGPKPPPESDGQPVVFPIFAVDWDAALAGQASAIPTVDPPPPAGLADFAADKGKAATLSNSPEASLIRHAAVGVIVGFGILTVAIIVLWKKRAA